MVDARYSCCRGKKMVEGKKKDLGGQQIIQVNSIKLGL